MSKIDEANSIIDKIFKIREKHGYEVISYVI